MKGVNVVIEKSLNNKLKKRRKELNLTMKDVAAAVGVSEGTVSRWESGNIANMGRDKIYALSKVLKMSPAEIMGIDDNNDNSKKDIDMRRIERARNNMTQQEKDKMMKILEASFEEYFTDNYVDTTDYSDEDED